jgi:hypothetical protein
MMVTHPDGATEEHWTDADGAQWTRETDEDGNVEKEVTIDYYQLDEETFVIMETDVDGNTVKEEYYRNDGSHSEIIYDTTTGEVAEEVFHNDDGSTTRYYVDNEGFEVYETTDEWDQTTVDRYNEATGENSREYEDDYGNWVSESYDATTGEMTREVYDDYGTVFVETYGQDGEMIGDVVVQDTEGWVFGDCTDEEVAGNWETTCYKSRTNADGNEETEVEVFSYPTDSAAGTTGFYGTQVCSTVTRTFFDQSTETFDRTCDGFRITADGS